jgi:beta-lactamase superfamily II metal-dependent hydrolase
MKSKFFLIPLIILLLLSINITVFAHPGRVDASGGSDRLVEYATNPSRNPASIPEEISVLVDNTKIIFDQKPENINNRVLVPIRFVVEHMGYEVDWDETSQTVYISANDQPLVYNAIKTNNINVYINNEKVIFEDQQPVNIGGRVLIPVRFVAEKLGYTVEWDQDSQTVEIKKNAAVVVFDDLLTVHFIDVGQGDSILIDYYDYEILIDSGTHIYGKFVAEYVKPYIDGSIELIIATHLDSDHMGGFLDVIKAYDIDRILWNGEKKRNQFILDFIYAAAKADKMDIAVAEIIDLGTSTTLEIIPPAKDYGTSNNNCIVSLLKHHGVNVLFAADAEAEAEKDLIKKLPEVDVLKVGHHGSRTSSHPFFLDVIKPKYAIFSAGQNNSSGHPHYETVERLISLKTTLFGTFRDGTIIMSIHDKGYTFNEPEALTIICTGGF